jgi:hypothetical protein
LEYWKRAYQRSEFYRNAIRAMSEDEPESEYYSSRLPEFVIDKDLALGTPVAELLLLHLDGEVVASVQSAMTATTADMERFSTEADPKLAIQREVAAHEQMSQAMLSMIDQLTRLRHQVLTALEPTSADGKADGKKKKGYSCRKIQTSAVFTNCFSPQKVQGKLKLTSPGSLWRSSK